MARPNTGTFQDLPVELHLQISDFLDYPTRLILSQTNRYFRSLVKVERPTTVEQQGLYLCAIETWERYHGYYACSYCLQLLPEKMFSDDQITGERGKDEAQNHLRFCIDCGIHEEIYEPAEQIWINGRLHFLCEECLELRGYGIFCSECSSCECCMASKMSENEMEDFVNQKLVDVDCPCCGTVGYYLQDLGEPEYGEDPAVLRVLPLTMIRPALRFSDDDSSETTDTEIDEDNDTEEETC
ncbi:hypothetical protein PVAR5_3149 [Paecilomyces variotii No. 5]|uniref:F-box domain-containing protein n=1 Tax=Byssochlamys spectabilis (strain No. 5 / NBRC 109023) TaxID=1356009 RepID=V5FRA1_BYSSN|nr:hypothetical protein PVAR5_3149 [Paecilomyces variotii No. 5]